MYIFLLIIIDDFSRYCWTFLWKAKNEVFEIFLIWKSIVENEKGRKFKYLKTNNGLEFFKPFQKICEDNGITSTDGYGSDLGGFSRTQTQIHLIF